MSRVTIRYAKSALKVVEANLDLLEEMAAQPQSKETELTEVLLRIKKLLSLVADYLDDQRKHTLAIEVAYCADIHARDKTPIQAMIERARKKLVDVDEFLNAAT